MNIENILDKASKQLNSSNIKNVNLDCEVLLSNTISKDREYLILNLKQNLDKKYIDFFYNLIERRKKGEPVAYLINKKEFWKETFYVNKDVLIPRPDTEHLIEEVIEYTEEDSKLHILDISIPVPLKFFLSFNIDNKIHPEPVPISRICNLESSSVYFITSSIKCSVSGLGINTSLLT